MMSSKVVLTAVVFIILCVADAAPAASDDFGSDVKPDVTIWYNVPTRPTSGQMLCSVDIHMANRDPTTTHSVTVNVETFGGEISIPEYFITDGFQPGCDIFPAGPKSRVITLGPKETRSGVVVIFLHAHILKFCDEGGQAQGFISLTSNDVFLESITIHAGRMTCDALDEGPLSD